MTSRALSTLSTVIALAAACLVGFAACGDDLEGPEEANILDEETRPEVRQQLEQLRAATEAFADIEKAIQAGYDANIGCIDETTAGVAAAQARGMGYHVTKSGTDLVGDGTVDLMTPEFLVYAPADNDASLPPEQRVGNAKLVGFDYFVPGDPALGKDDPNPPTLFGQPFNWSEGFQGWMRHIYVFEENPQGLYADWNPAVSLCTELLGGEPIGSLVGPAKIVAGRMYH